MESDSESEMTTNQAPEEKDVITGHTIKKLKKRAAEEGEENGSAKRRKVLPSNVPRRHQNRRLERQGLEEFIKTKCFRKATVHRLCQKGGALMQTKGFTEYAQYALYSLIADLTRKAAACTRMKDCQWITPQDLVMGAKHSMGTTLYACHFSEPKKPKSSKKEAGEPEEEEEAKMEEKPIEL